MKQNRKFLKAMITVGLCILVMLELKSTVIANEVELDSINNKAQERMLKIAEKYDMRDSINIKLKNQMQTNTCWAFSATTVLETYMMKVKNRNVEYSPRHLEYATTREFLDGTNDVVFNRVLDMGGGVDVISSYLTSGMGPVLEKDMPFTNSKEKIKLEEIKNKPVDAMVKEYIIFTPIYKEFNDGQIKYTNGRLGELYKEYTSAEVEKIRNDIKEQVMQYSAITVGILQKNECYSNDGKSYYCDDSKYMPNHGVSIIGWDDNYPVENFNPNCRPSKPGAWLVQNSNGMSHPYFYVAYDDAWVEVNAFAVKKMDDINYDKIYQHNYYISNDWIGYSSNSTSVINVFEKGAGVEQLNAISFNTCEDEEYEVYVNPIDGSTDQSKFKLIKSIGKTISSYITIDLDNPIELSNDKFAVMVKYTNPNGYVLVPVESRNPNNSRYIYCKSEPGESFIYERGKFVDLKESNIVDNANACIKAFTKIGASTSTPTPGGATPTPGGATPTTSIADSKISSNKYVTDKDNRIKGVLPETTLEEFKSNITSNISYDIFDKDNNKVTNNEEIMKTGMALSTKKQEKYIIIVKGDTNGDGKVSGTDLIKTKKHLVEIESLEGDYLIAGDINGDGNVTPTDTLNITQYICEIVTW